MSIPSVYINLEDDVSKIVTRLKHNSSKQVILVCPKRCFLFNDSINLRLLKKQTDLLGKEVFILTMDERGQLYSKEAGFGLKFLPKAGGSRAMSDVRVSSKETLATENKPETGLEHNGMLENAVNEIKHIAKNLIPTSKPSAQEEVALPVVEKKEAAAHNPKVKVTEVMFPEAFVEKYSPHEQKEPVKSRRRKILTGVTALVLIVVLVLWFVVLPKAVVVAYPKTEPVTRDMEISMSANVSALDAAKLIIPASKVDETVSVNGKFQSQGKKQVGNKASGNVLIYNFTSLPINLKAATTALVVAGKTYNLVNDVSGIKPTTYKNKQTKEVDEASLGDPVEIIAADGGDDYNLPAGTRVEITNKVFGSKPQLLYAKTYSEINGGTTRYLSIIVQDDITTAQNQLQTQALQQIKAKLKNSSLSLPEKSYDFQVTQFTTDNAVGAESPSFQATMQAKLSGLAYKENDLSQIIKQRITETMSANKTLQSKDQNSTSIKVKSFDPSSQLAVLLVHYEGQAVFDIDLANIESELVGKSLNDANELLRSKAEIDKVDITLAPAWQKNFPLFVSKIKVSVGQTE